MRNMRKLRWMWEQRLTHLKNYGHIQKHMDTREFYFLKKNFKVNFKLGLLC